MDENWVLMSNSMMSFVLLTFKAGFYLGLGVGLGLRLGLGVVLGLGLGSELALGQGESCVKNISTRIYSNYRFAQTGKPDKNKRSVLSSKFFPRIR